MSNTFKSVHEMKMFVALLKDSKSGQSDVAKKIRQYKEQDFETAISKYLYNYDNK